MPVATSVPTGPGQVGTCTQGTCGVACAPGHADCNGDPADGCEVDTATDPGNCGACGTTCTAAGPNQSPACSAGQCAATCDTGFADCNGSANDGCETPLGTLTDCTACGDSCGAVANAVADL